MISLIRVCEKCGAKIPGDARQGVCAACLLETGLGLLAEEPVGPREPQAGRLRRMRCAASLLFRLRGAIKKPFRFRGPGAKA
jgi:hypothetical protein